MEQSEHLEDQVVEDLEVPEVEAVVVLPFLEEVVVVEALPYQEEEVVVVVEVHQVLLGEGVEEVVNHLRVEEEVVVELVVMASLLDSLTNLLEPVA